MALMHTAAVTRFRGRCAVESLGPAPTGPDDVPNGWVRVLGEGVADDVLAVTVISALNECDRPVPVVSTSPAAQAFEVEDEQELAEPGAAKVLAEYDGTSILIFGLANRGPGTGFVMEEEGVQREVLAAESAQVLGSALRGALDDATG